MKNLAFISGLAALFFTGCDDQKIHVYSVPKENPLAIATAANVESANSEATWNAPQGWKEQPAKPPRLATFLIEGAQAQKAEVTLIAFPGGAGSDLDNVNRWRAQIALLPIAEAELASALQKVEANGQVFLVTEMNNEGKAIRGAILHREDRAWFVKMMGDAAVVAAQKDSFTEFLKSLRIGETPPSAVAEPAPAAAPLSVAAENPKTKPSWKTPAGWQEQPASGMRVGSFSVVEDDRKADISVIQLGGAAGGTLANLNRWRQQLSLPPIADSDLAGQTEKVATASGDALLVDIVGEAPTIAGKFKARIIGAILEHGGESWFVKMNGEDALVEKQKPAFVAFVKSIKLP